MTLSDAHGAAIERHLIVIQRRGQPSPLHSQLDRKDCGAMIREDALRVPSIDIAIFRLLAECCG